MAEQKKGYRAEFENCENNNNTQAHKILKEIIARKTAIDSCRHVANRAGRWPPAANSCNATSNG
jgi:hypothetical protein